MIFFYVASVYVMPLTLLAKRSPYREKLRKLINRFRFTREMVLWFLHFHQLNHNQIHPWQEKYMLTNAFRRKIYGFSQIECEKSYKNMSNARQRKKRPSIIQV